MTSNDKVIGFVGMVVGFVSCEKKKLVPPGPGSSFGRFAPDGVGYPRMSWSCLRRIFIICKREGFHYPFWIYSNILGFVLKLMLFILYQR